MDTRKHSRDLNRDSNRAFLVKCRNAPIVTWNDRVWWYNYGIVEFIARMQRLIDICHKENIIKAHAQMLLTTQKVKEKLGFIFASKFLFQNGNFQAKV